MVIPISFLLQSIGLFLAAKALKVNLNIVTAPIAVFVSTAAAYFIPGLLGLIIAIIVYYISIRMFDRQLDFVSFVGLVFVGLIVQGVLMELVVEPLLEHYVLSQLNHQ